MGHLAGRYTPESSRRLLSILFINWVRIIASVSLPVIRSVALHASHSLTVLPPP